METIKEKVKEFVDNTKEKVQGFVANTTEKVKEFVGNTKEKVQGFVANTTEKVKEFVDKNFTELGSDKTKRTNEKPSNDKKVEGEKREGVTAEDIIKDTKGGLLKTGVSAAARALGYNGDEIQTFFNLVDDNADSIATAMNEGGYKPNAIGYLRAWQNGNFDNIISSTGYEPVSFNDAFDNLRNNKGLSDTKPQSNEEQIAIEYISKAFETLASDGDFTARDQEFLQELITNSKEEYAGLKEVKLSESEGRATLTYGDIELSSAKVNEGRV